MRELLVFAASLSAALAAEQTVGYYSWNWGSGSNGPPNANTAVAFTGLIDVKTAIAGYTPGASWCCPVLKGTKYLSLGGGNAAGMFTEASLKAIVEDMPLVNASEYNGVMFDVEEVVGNEAVMVPAFATAFAACKAYGLRVGVTTSHSAPYQTDSPADAVALVKAWVADPNIDFISPQLYSNGQEAAPELAITANCAPECNWGLYRGARNAFMPSLVDQSHLPAVEAFFSNSSHQIPVTGFFQWRQKIAS